MPIICLYRCIGVYMLSLDSVQTLFYNIKVVEFSKRKLKEEQSKLKQKI